MSARPTHARMGGDPRQRAALIEEFVPPARSLAWRLRSRAAHEDLVQVAWLLRRSSNDFQQRAADEDGRSARVA